MPWDRRRFFSVLGAGTAATLVGCGGGAERPGTARASAGRIFTKDLGAQLYTLRSVLPENPAATLSALAAIGYKEAEVLQRGWDELAPLVKDAGLRAPALHVQSSVVTGQWGDQERPPHSTVEAAAEWIAGHGIGWMIMPYLAAYERGDNLGHYKRLGGALNRAGEICKAAGLGLAYHNHAFEFEPMEGSTPLDALLGNCDPELVKLELDVFWVSVAGLDPAAMLRRYGNRVKLVHLKHKAPGVPAQFREGLPPEAFREVGNGTMDFAAILSACEQAGVEHYFVEQDQTPDPLGSLRQSYANLRAMELAQKT